MKSASVARNRTIKIGEDFMSPEEFAKLPAGLRSALAEDVTPSVLNTKYKEPKSDPYTKAGVASLLGEAYDPYMSKGTRGLTYRADADAPSSPSFITYNPADKNPAMTKAHEMEHALANQGRGGGHHLNRMWDEMVGKEGGRRGEIVSRLIEHAPYLQSNWGLLPEDADAGYFSKHVTKRPDARNFLYEQMATLSALEQGANKRFVEDPYVRKNILKTPAEREAYEAMTNLRQTRLDAKDLPPYTRQPGSTSIKGDEDNQDFITKLKKLIGYANGGVVDAAGNRKTI
jgi:hypothetical protein